MNATRWIACAALVVCAGSGAAIAQDSIPTFDALLAHKVALKPELVGVHPRVFVTRSELNALRERGDGKAGGGNEVVVLREDVAPSRPRRERVVDESGMPLE